MPSVAKKLVIVQDEERDTGDQADPRTEQASGDMTGQGAGEGTGQGEHTGHDAQRTRTRNTPARARRTRPDECAF